MKIQNLTPSNMVLDERGIAEVEAARAKAGITPEELERRRIASLNKPFTKVEADPQQLAAKASANASEPNGTAETSAKRKSALQSSDTDGEESASTKISPGSALGD